MTGTPSADGLAPRLSRRRVLAGAGVAALGGTGVAYLSTERVSASVTMGELTITGDDASVSGPPARIDVHVSGEWSVEAPNIPEMVTVTLQVHEGGLNGDVDDVASASAFDASSGTFEIGADLYEHRGIDPGDLVPAEAGGSKTTPFLIRVILTVVDGGEQIAEDFVEDTADVTLNDDGVTASIGGAGSLSVVP